VGKFWSLLFLLVPVLGVATFWFGADYGMALPRDISEHGHQIDHLYYFILLLTGAVFVATEVVLFWFLWKYDKASQRGPVMYTHGSHNLEVVWTILPAATLLFIAIYQMNAWADVKMRKPNIPPTVEVTARQFEWRIRYPGEDGAIGTKDDIHTVNDLHIPVDTDILVNLKSMDVLHSFFLPNMRIKQDAVPGHVIPMWFRAQDTGTFDLVCAELCGWGHYKMKGRLTVDSKDDFEDYLRRTYQEQEAVDEPAASPGEAVQ
jgi:cytochrome c oxidase subunit II